MNNENINHIDENPAKNEKIVDWNKDRSKIEIKKPKIIITENNI